MYGWRFARLVAQPINGIGNRGVTNLVIGAHRLPNRRPQPLFLGGSAIFLAWRTGFWTRPIGRVDIELGGVFQRRGILAVDQAQPVFFKRDLLKRESILFQFSETS